MPNLERTQSAPAGSIEVERRRKNSVDPTETEAELTVATAKDVASEEVTKEAAKEVTKEVIDTNLSRPVDFTQESFFLKHVLCTWLLKDNAIIHKTRIQNENI